MGSTQNTGSAQFHILGPIEVLDGEARPIRLPGSKTKALLAEGPQSSLKDRLGAASRCRPGEDLRHHSGVDAPARGGIGAGLRWQHGGAR